MSYPSVTKVTADVVASVGRTAVGCCAKDGKIIPMLSAESLSVLNIPSPTFAEYCESIKKFAIYASGNVYFTDENPSAVKTSAQMLSTKPYVVHTTYGGGLESYLFGDSKCVRMRSSQITLLDNACKALGGVYKNSRVFCVDGDDPYKIIWSDGDSGPVTWTQGKNLSGWAYVKENCGKIVDLAVYKNEVVALCEYGLCVFSAFGSTENFKRAYAGGNLKKVDERTVAEAAEKLVFCSGGEVCSYDGNSVKKFEHEYADDFYTPEYAAAIGDWYYVCGKSKKLLKDVILAVNIRSGEAYYIDSDVKVICPRGCLYGFDKQNLYAFGQGGYTFTSGILDFGTPRRKLLKSIHLGNCDGVEIEVRSGVKSRILRGIRGYCRIDMSGNSFKITVRGDCEIGGIQAIAEVISGD